MELIDSHCHLYDLAFQEDRDEMLKRAMDGGVTRFYLPAVDKESEPAMLALEKRYPNICFAMQGLHPCSVRRDINDALEHVAQSLASRPFSAVGEIGLDFYWDRSFEKEQYRAFHQQIEWAKNYQLPIVIHSRESMEQTISVVTEHQRGDLQGIFHCFTEDEKSARQIMDLGFYLGIGGVLTYKNSKLPSVIRQVGIRQVVLETDAPYLPPVPFRGKRNESSYIRIIAEKLAEILDMDLEEVAAITTANARKVFKQT